MRLERKCPATLRPVSRCRGELRPNSHCLCVLRWERYVRCQGASRASQAPGASGRSLCVRTHIFFPDVHATAAKRVLRYLKTTAGFRIHYRLLPNPITIVGYTDSDWAGNLTTRKSVGGCVFGLGNTNVNNELVISGLIHWQSKSQSVVALSTLQAEYIACSHATRESLWLRRMMKEGAGGMAVKIVDGLVPIGCDNQGAIKLITSGVIRQKSKHIDVKYHHVHDEQVKGAVKFHYVTSESNPTDLLTKPLAIPRHEQLLQLIGLTPLVSHDSTKENPNTMNEDDLEKEKGGCGSLVKKRGCGSLARKRGCGR